MQGVPLEVMRIPGRVVSGANRVLVRFDLHLLRGEQLRRMTGLPSPRGSFQNPKTAVLADADDYLRLDNPRLQELSRRYSSFKRELSGDTQWTDHYVLKEIDLRNFRSDNAFLYQVRDGNTVTGYALTAFYLRTIDRFSLMAKLHEDGCFGAHVVDFNGQCLVSRDLLDSIFEIYFLDQVFDL